MDRKPCASPDCDNSVGMNVAMDFCFNCTGKLLAQRDELLADLDKVLRLEADFVQWCDEHGHPHPHE